MFDTPQIPPIYLGWFGPNALTADTFRQVFELRLRTYGWHRIISDDGSTEGAVEGLAKRPV